ncbi:MAG TPA: thioredoxin family protein [Chryseolinea sp.]
MFIRFAHVLFFLVVISATHAQILQPARLAAETPTKNLKVGDEVELIFRASVDKGWYIYSVGFDDECGPIPMAVTLEKHPSFSLVGDLTAVNDQPKHDKIFDCDVRIFINAGEFRQKIKVLTPDLTLTGSYEGQVCSEVEGKCVLFSGDLLFEKINVTGKASPIIEVPKEKRNEEAPREERAPTDTVKSTLPPAEIKSELKGPVLDKSILDDSGATGGDESLWGYMIVAFILGITSLITPCVFPMIPMTVTFFLKDDQGKAKGIRTGIAFGICIILIYTVVGTAFALLFGAEGLNALATHWLPNLFIFLIFIIFALSFLGLFEITAPHSLVNKADRASEKGGYAGIFFMSATLVLVSFSCTLPLVGNVLVLAAGGEIVKPIMGMFAYSLAFAIPFTLFAIFPEWLKSLPKSGGWLNSVKVVLGLLELALALKFLSIADQTYHWGLLDRDVNIAIWIVIFSFLGVYLLGRIKMPHDSPVERVTVPRLILSILTFSFVVYLIPGLWGAPLKALAGYLPPMHTHDFDLISLAKTENGTETCDRPKYSEFLHLPHKLNGYFDYEQAMACAREQQKPLFIDFTGHGCTNCREMEAVVWSDPEVLKRLQNDFVVVALYVDDKTELPENEWYTSKYDNKVKKTIGKQNADLQIANLNNNAQPFYVLVGKDERVLASPYGYDKSVEGFVNFLDQGKLKYQELYSQ